MFCHIAILYWVRATRLAERSMHLAMHSNHEVLHASSMRYVHNSSLAPIRVVNDTISKD